MIDSINEEIEGIHATFVAWFAGVAPRDREEFDRLVTDRMTVDFSIVMPGGRALDRAALVEAIFSDHGTNPAFRIQIRNLAMRAVGQDLVVATYEEWQRNAANSSPPDNARLSTAIFRRREGRLLWLHVHETWMAAAAMAVGPFDF